MTSYEVNKRYQDIVNSRETWRIKPFIFCDERFDFSDMEKKEEKKDIIVPFIFVNNNDNNPKF